LISQLEVHGAPLSKEDINQKFLRSLPPSWSQIALIIRNKPDIDQVDIDDLYNNLRVYEDEMKSSSSSTSNSQNLAFLSSKNTSSTNEVSSTPGADEVVCSFFAHQATSPPLDNEDLQQIDQDGLEELDIRQQVAMLTVRVQRFVKKTGRNLDFKGKEPVTFDTRNATTNEPSSQALVAQDGLGGYDWSNDFDEPTSPLQAHQVLLIMRARLEIQGYELALESLESRILGHEKNELAWGEKYEFQNYELKCRELKIDNLKMELEKVVKERDDLKVKIEKWEESSKGLNKILNSQMSAKDKNSLGYGTQKDEMSNKSETDSEISLDEYAITKKIIESKTTEMNTDISKSKTSETVGKTNEVNMEKPKSVHESSMSKQKINRDKVIIEDWYSDDEDDESEVNTISPVKTNVIQTVETQVDKIGQTSQKEGIGFKKIKACFVCKSTDYLIKDCDFYAKKSPEPKLKTMLNTSQRVVKPVWDNAKRVNHQKNSNKYPQSKRTFVPSGVLTRTCLVNPVRPNGKRAAHTVSTARPISTASPISTARPFALKIAQTGSAIRPIYPRMDNGNPEIRLQDHAVVDSGCSSHITGNKAFLLDYEDYNGGFVAFGSDPKRSKITGKVNQNRYLDFDEVYLFICKCNNNMRSKFVAQEIRLRKPIEHNSLNSLEVDQRTEFKNHAMNEFCAKKGIKREFSMARTPQQNGVAERKNRTLIEAARTMLADSLLPIPFWAEAVNTACYVLNRVLVTKPQNKTPYELLIGKPHSISFMRPFGCPLTILNTLDPLGKFDGKSDEGYLLGYSTSSKAFRVYNKRVEESLHIDFLEDQPNVAGNGIQESYVAGSSGSNKETPQEYILLPLHPHGPRIIAEDVAEKEEQHNLSEAEQALKDDLEKLVTQEMVAKAIDDATRQAFEEEKQQIASLKRIARATSINKLNTGRQSV
ncbi:retrovirus-related pol polyprotein from transposon TNT 1-94, partial [Tanacetum coccineum]